MEDYMGFETQYRFKVWVETPSMWINGMDKPPLLTYEAYKTQDFVNRDEGEFWARQASKDYYMKYKEVQRDYRMRYNYVTSEQLKQMQLDIWPQGTKYVTCEPFPFRVWYTVEEIQLVVELI